MKEERMNEDFKEYLNRKMKISKIDNLFLYLTSLFGFLYSLIQLFFSKEDIIYFILLLVPGLILPIYFGYLRGALEDNAEERIRGWLYLIVGIPFYALSVLPNLLRFRQNTFLSVNGIDIKALLMIVIILIFSISVLMTIFMRSFIQKLKDFILYLCKRKSSFATDKMISETVISAFFLSFALSIIPIFRMSLPIWSSLFLLYFMISSLIITYIYCRFSERWSVISKYFEYVDIEVKPSSRYYLFQRIGKIGLTLSFFFTIILYSLYLYLYYVIGRLGMASLLIIEIASSTGAFSFFLLFFIFKEIYLYEPILKIKKDIEVPNEIKNILEKLIKKYSSD